MALSTMVATVIALDPAVNKLLTRVARGQGISRAEFIRRQLDIALGSYRSGRKAIPSAPAAKPKTKTSRKRG